MKVDDKETSDLQQVNEWLVAIETNQKDIEDAIKDLINKVKYIVTTLYVEMSDIVISVKVLMLAIRNSLQEGGASK